MRELTVGIPVHNGMPWLRHAVDSLLRQTYADFQVLIVDDGSSDDTADFLATVKDPRFRIVSQPNCGLTTTLNRMLAEATTPWLVRLDADDVCFPERLEIVRQAIQNYPDAAAFYSYARYFQDGVTFGTFRTTTGSPQQLRKLTRAGYLLAICHPTVALNVEKARAVGGYRFDLAVEDIDLWWRLALRYDIRLLPFYTVGFRLNPDSVCARNLEPQAVNTLYAQYLLISHLLSIQPSSYEAVCPHLRALVDANKLNFRAHVRNANVAAARSKYALAIRHLASAFVASPLRFLSRAAYEMLPSRAVVNGIHPQAFLARAAQLWPEHDFVPTLEPKVAQQYAAGPPR